MAGGHSLSIRLTSHTRQALPDEAEPVNSRSLSDIHRATHCLVRFKLLRVKCATAPIAYLWPDRCGAHLLLLPAVRTAVAHALYAGARADTASAAELDLAWEQWTSRQLVLTSLDNCENTRVHLGQIGQIGQIGGDTRVRAAPFTMQISRGFRNCNVSARWRRERVDKRCAQDAYGVPGTGWGWCSGLWTATVFERGLREGCSGLGGGCCLGDDGHELGLGVGRPCRASAGSTG